MGLKKTTGTARASDSQNLSLNIATLCPACWPWLCTVCSSAAEPTAWLPCGVPPGLWFSEALVRAGAAVPVFHGVCS